MIAIVRKYKHFQYSSRVVAAVIFVNERGETLREVRVVIPDYSTVQKLYQEAIKAAKQECSEPEFIQAYEDPPRCEHGEPILGSWSMCLLCFLEDERMV